MEETSPEGGERKEGGGWGRGEAAGGVLLAAVSVLPHLGNGTLATFLGSRVRNAQRV